MKSDAQLEEMFKLASEARMKAYAPYSNYRVGAAVVVGDKIISGANIENSSYGATICAERVAIAKAVSDGASKIERVLVLTENGAPPCGICRQSLTEFCEPETEIWLASASGIEKKYKLKDLIPLGFSSAHLTKVK